MRKSAPTPQALRLAESLQGVDAYAVETLISHGPGYWNPLLEHGGAKLLENLSDSMQLLHYLLDSGDDIEEIRPGMALMAQTMWAAVQYEHLRREAQNVEGQGVNHE